MNGVIVLDTAIFVRFIDVHILITYADKSYIVFVTIYDSGGAICEIQKMFFIHSNLIITKKKEYCQVLQMIYF